MQRNVGTVDQAVRIAAGLIIIAVGLYFQSFWGFIGLVPLLTGLTRRCPGYAVLGVSTDRDTSKTA